MRQRTQLLLVSTVLTAVILAPQGDAAEEPRVVRPRVLAIDFDPIIESRSNQRLHRVAGWNNPRSLNIGYVNDFESASHGLLRQRLVQDLLIDVFPVKVDGFSYTDDSYLDALFNGTGWHQPDGVDYKAIARDYDLARRVDLGQIDEVFVHGAPYFGYYESRMAGRGAYWINSPPLTRVASSRKFVMMGFNYERGVAEMLHSCGYRSEDIIKRSYGGFWDLTKSRTDWERFTHNIGQSPDAACGSVHYPPNGVADYDYANPTPVVSTAIDWMDNFPNLTGQTSVVSRDTWGGPDYHRNFMKWWYSHMPHVAGTNDHDGMTRLNSWWPYLFDFNRYAESGGEHVPGGPAPPAVPFDGPVVRLTTDAADDWLPQVNDGGRVVWSGHDGNDFEIYSANADGSGFVQVTSDTRDDEFPRINNAGRIVWQRFDGQDYEILSANADGSDLVQITSNGLNDWHATINDAGRLVWDGHDGQDYEIFAADADGANLVQITNNQAAANQYPREDVWPQINAFGRVVWFGWDGGDWEIFSANDDGTGLVNVSNNTLEDEYPQINDLGTVVWHAWYSDSISEIYSAPATGGVALRLTISAQEDWYPQINNADRVVWMARWADGWEIYSIDADGQNEQAITANFTHDQHPQIDDAGQVVWHGFDGQDGEIYSWIDGTIVQLTDNDYDDKAPVLGNGGHIVWHAEAADGANGTTTEIFAVAPGCAADLDGDGDADVNDLTILLADFGCDTPACPGDVDGDGDTDVNDLTILLADFGCLP